MNAPAPRDVLGRPLRDLRLSVIDACNFRCPYCMPADRIPDDHGLDAAARLSFDELETLVRGFARLGVRKLRLTGGEPLLQCRVFELAPQPAQVPREVPGGRQGGEHPLPCPRGPRPGAGAALQHQLAHGGRRHQPAHPQRRAQDLARRAQVDDDVGPERSE